jgi:hypothetical protein
MRRCNIGVLRACRWDGKLIHMGADADNELIDSITRDVMKCLVRSGFFEKLDDVLCPRDDSYQRQRCRGTTSSPNLYC